MRVVFRRTALQEGLHKYFTGEPCKNGHVDMRYTATASCVSCRREYNRDKFMVSRYFKIYREEEDFIQELVGYIAMWRKDLSGREKIAFLKSYFETLKL